MLLFRDTAETSQTCWRAESIRSPRKSDRTSRKNEKVLVRQYSTQAGVNPAGLYNFVRGFTRTYKLRRL